MHLRRPQTYRDSARSGITRRVVSDLWGGLWQVCDSLIIKREGKENTLNEKGEREGETGRDNRLLNWQWLTSSFSTQPDHRGYYLLPKCAQAPPST